MDRGGVLSPPLPGAGAPAKPQSRGRYFAVPDHTGDAHPRAYVDVPVNVACCVFTGAMWVAVALQWQDQLGMPPHIPQTGPRGSRQ